MSASIGIVLYPRDGDDLDTLLKNADVAMYHAKAQGRNRFFFYSESMRAASAQRLSLEHDLRKALEGEQFELYYQPQIEVRTGKIVGIEALIRWNHPTLGLLRPAHFIGVAEEAGLIMAIWEWVLVTALIQHNAWLEQGLARGHHRGQPVERAVQRSRRSPNASRKSRASSACRSTISSSK